MSAERGVRTVWRRSCPPGHSGVHETVLTPKGAQPSKACPICIPANAKVEVVEDDAGEGASEIRCRGQNWFVDEQRLD